MCCCSTNRRTTLTCNTLRALEEALSNFAGCAVVISHDRWFLDRIATHILAFEGESKVVWYDGNYSEYEADRKKRLGHRRRPAAPDQVQEADERVGSLLQQTKCPGLRNWRQVVKRTVHIRQTRGRAPRTELHGFPHHMIHAQSSKPICREDQKREMDTDSLCESVKGIVVVELNGLGQIHLHPPRRTDFPGITIIPPFLNICRLHTRTQDHPFITQQYVQDGIFDTFLTVVV